MSTIYWIRLIRFRSYLLVLRNKRAADIGFKKDFHRMVACLRLGVATSPPAFCLEWVNWRDIFVHAAITETIVKINLERIKEHFESLMDREQTIFHSKSFSTNYINTLRNIVEHCAVFKSPFGLLSIDCSKFYTLSRWMRLRNECWTSATVRRRTTK